MATYSDPLRMATKVKVYATLAACFGLIWALAGSTQPDCPAFGREGDAPPNCVPTDHVNYGARLQALLAAESAASFSTVRETVELPAEVHSMLVASVPLGGVAEWGDDWNSGDVVSSDRPMAQHIVSFVSERVSAVVFRTGGITRANMNLLLTDASSPVYCVYSSLGEPFLSNVTIEALQLGARYDRFRQAGSACREKGNLVPRSR